MGEYSGSGNAYCGQCGRVVKQTPVVFHWECWRELENLKADLTTARSYIELLEKELEELKGLQ